MKEREGRGHSQRAIEGQDEERKNSGRCEDEKCTLCHKALEMCALLVTELLRCLLISLKKQDA